MELPNTYSEYCSCCWLPKSLHGPELISIFLWWAPWFPRKMHGSFEVMLLQPSPHFPTKSSISPSRTAVPPRTVIQGNSRFILSLCSCCIAQQYSQEPWACDCKHSLLTLLPSEISTSTERALGLPSAGPRDKDTTGKICQEGNHGTTVICSNIPEFVKLQAPMSQKKFHNPWTKHNRLCIPITEQLMWTAGTCTNLLSYHV